MIAQAAVEHAGGGAGAGAVLRTLLSYKIGYTAWADRKCMIAQAAVEHAGGGGGAGAVRAR